MRLCCGRKIGRSYGCFSEACRCDAKNPGDSNQVTCHVFTIPTKVVPYCQGGVSFTGRKSTQKMEFQKQRLTHVIHIFNNEDDFGIQGPTTHPQCHRFPLQEIASLINMCVKQFCSKISCLKQFCVSFRVETDDPSARCEGACLVLKYYENTRHPNTLRMRISFVLLFRTAK